MACSPSIAHYCDINFSNLYFDFRSSRKENCRAGVHLSFFPSFTSDRFGACLNSSSAFTGLNTLLGQVNSRRQRMSSICGCSITPKDISDMKDAPDHLLVLVHGILASPSDWTYADAELKRQLGGSFLIYASSSNSYTKTFGGIDGAGRRLADEVLRVVEQMQNLKRISFLAHSLGGLFARYAISILYSSDTRTIAGLEPINFITLATPHLGVRGKRQASESDIKTAVASRRLSRYTNLLPERKHFNFLSPNPLRSAAPRNEPPPSATRSRRNLPSLISTSSNLPLPFLFGVPILEKLAPPIAPILIGKTGRQLFLTDGKPSKPPLLLRMASDYEDHMFISSLAAFKRRCLYANVSYDHMVGWRTSSIRRETELVKPPLRSLDGYKHIVDVQYCPPVQSDGPHFPPDASKAKAAAQNMPNAQNTTEYHDIMEEEMIRGLQRVGWKKVDVSFHSAFWPFFAHNNIHVKSERLHNAGASVIAHVADCLKQHEARPAIVASL